MKTKGSMMKKGLCFLAGCLAATFGYVAGAQAGQGNADIGALDENCVFNFNSGAGETNFDWCLSSNGNIVKLESPQGQEHIRVGGFIEGYAVCSAFGQSGRDYAQAGQIAGFGPTTLVGCTAAGCVFRRDTTDGLFRLLMDIKQVKANKALKIKTTVTNRSPAPISDVQVIRYVDADMNNDFGDDRADRSNRSAWARDVDALVLSGTTYSNVTSVYARLDDDIGPNGTCKEPDTLTVPAGPEDVGLVVGYDLGTINPGASKAVFFQLRRQ